MVERRLIESSDVPLEREMLRAAASEGAPPEARHRTLAALGLLGVAPLAGAVSSGGVAASPAAASMKALWWKGWVAKCAWFLGVGGAGIAVGAYSSEQGPNSTPGAPATPVSPPVTKASRDALPSETSRPREMKVAGSNIEESAVAADAVRRSTSARKSGAGARSPVAMPSSARSLSIREEIDLLDAARAELRRGDLPAALGRIDEYLRRFPKGELLDEARAIGAEARKPR